MKRAYLLKSFAILTSFCFLLTINTQNAQQQSSQDSLQFKSLRILELGKTVNNGCGDFGTNQYQPNIAHDSKGNYLITWVDNRAGKLDIRAQLFDKSDAKAGAEIQINNEISYFDGVPDITFSETKNEYLITWIHLSKSVMLARVSQEGKKLKEELIVHKSENFNLIKSSVEVFSNGNILVTWYTNGYDYNPYVLYYAVLNSNGEIIKKPGLINPDEQISSGVTCWDKGIAVDSLGNAVVTWKQRYRRRESQIYIQTINSNGSLIGSPIPMLNTSSENIGFYPSIESLKNGTYLVCWSVSDSLYGRIFQSLDRKTSAPFLIAKTPSSRITLSTDMNENFFVFYTSDKSYSNILNKKGEKVSEQKVYPLRLLPAPFTVISEGSLIVCNLSFSKEQNIKLVYVAKNANDYDVMKLKFDTKLNIVGEPIKISDDKCSAWQISPIVKYNKKGESIVLWTDLRNGRRDFYFQVYDINNNPVGENTMLNDPTATYYDLSNIVVDTEDNFVLAYRINDANYNYCAQKISGKGMKIGTSYKFATSTMVFARYSFHSLENGEYLFVTMPQSQTLREIQVTKLNSNFNTVTKIDGFFKENVKSSFNELSYSINSKKDILFTWIENLRMRNTVLKGIILNENGNIVRDTFVVSNLDRNSYYAKISNSFDKDYNIAITWNQMEYNNSSGNFYIHAWRSYPKFGTKFNSYPLPINFHSSTIYKFFNKKLFFTSSHKYEIKGFYIDDKDSTLSAYSLHNFSESDLGLKYGYNSSSFGIDLFNNRLKLCYESVKEPNKGFEVYQDLFALDEFDFTSVSPEQTNNNSKVATMIVSNPIRSTGLIRYTINQESNVNIVLYNILGQRIKDVENKKQLPGEYQVKIDVNDLASGVYLIHFNGIKSFTKKLMIIR